MDAVSTAMTTALGTVATGALDAIGDILPIVLPIVGAVAIVTIGIKVFKKFAKG